MVIQNRRALFALIPLLLALFTLTLAAPSRAQVSPTAASVHHKNWVQRHPTLTGIGAGVATHHALKVSARNAKRRGQRLNWAQRHPTLSALGVGVATHHVIKKTTH